MTYADVVAEEEVEEFVSELVEGRVHRQGVVLADCSGPVVARVVSVGVAMARWRAAGSLA